MKQGSLSANEVAMDRLAGWFGGDGLDRWLGCGAGQAGIRAAREIHPHDDELRAATHPAVARHVDHPVCAD